MALCAVRLKCSALPTDAPLLFLLTTLQIDGVWLYDDDGDDDDDDQHSYIPWPTKWSNIFNANKRLT